MVLLDYFQIANEIKKQPITEPDKQDEKPIVANNQIEKKEIDIRINNTFVNAQKQYLESARELIRGFANDCKTGKVKSIIIDSIPVASSDTNMILTCSSFHGANEANEMLDEIEKMLLEVTGKNYKMVFITQENWEQVKNEYIKNLKSGKKYEYIIIEESTENDEINDVFDISKVEII